MATWISSLPPAGALARVVMSPIPSSLWRAAVPEEAPAARCTCTATTVSPVSSGSEVRDRPCGRHWCGDRRGAEDVADGGPQLGGQLLGLAVVALRRHEHHHHRPHQRADGAGDADAVAQRDGRIGGERLEAAFEV